MRDLREVSVGTRVRVLRMERGYSREKLSENAKISVKFLYEIETDKKGFSAHTLVNLSEALGVSTDYIMTGHVMTGHAMTGHNMAGHGRKTDAGAALAHIHPKTLEEVEVLLKLAREWIIQDEKP